MASFTSFALMGAFQYAASMHMRSPLGLRRGVPSHGSPFSATLPVTASRSSATLPVTTSRSSATLTRRV